MDANAARQKLRGTLGMLAEPRPRDIDTPGTFNAYIDSAIEKLEALRFKEVAVTVEVEAEKTEGAQREEKSGTDRQHRGGQDRSE